MTQQQEGTDLTASWALLKEFSLKEFKGLGASYLATPKKRDQLRAALKVQPRCCWASLVGRKDGCTSVAFPHFTPPPSAHYSTTADSL